MTVHFSKRCIQVDHVVCEATCETKFNYRQPMLVMRGFTKEVKIITTGKKKTAIIKL